RGRCIGRCRSPSARGARVGAFRRPPSNARVPREPDPARVGRVRRGVRSGRLLRDLKEEFRGLVVQALVPPPETPIGWTPRETRRRPVRGDGSGPAGLAGGPRPRRAYVALSPDPEVVTPGRQARRQGLSSRLNCAV